MKNLLLILFAVLILASCGDKTDQHPNPDAMKARLDSLRQDLLQTDKSFSQLSEQKGRNAAFTDFAAEQATVLRPYSMPVTGKDTIVSLLNAHADSSYILSWTPKDAEVSRSGDLGFTYGTYQRKGKDGSIEEGTYCTVWKKDKNHAWKFVLDTGNEGLALKDLATYEKQNKKEGATEKKK